MERMNKKLASWKGKMLSLGARITLIKASLSSLPLYYMSLFPIPKGVIEKIVKTQRRFFWCGETRSKPMSLVSWELIELPKSLGGLGVGNLINRNLSLLFKWWWRFFSDSSALWRKIICEKYGYSSLTTILDLTTPTSGGPWRDICSTINNHPSAKYLSKCKLRKWIGSGTSTFFWVDIWVGNSPLQSYFPRLFRISSCPLLLSQQWAFGMGVYGDGVWNGLVG